MAGEVVFGVVAGSLALLADAGHMLTDAAALAGALVAARLATRPARAPWTFGLGRAEILAAQANGITLLLVGIWIVYGAARRLSSPPDVHGGVVLVVALLMLEVNHLKWIWWEYWDCRRCSTKHKDCGCGATARWIMFL